MIIGACVLLGIFLFPLKVECGVPGYACTTAPDSDGYIYRNYDVEPLGVMLLETVIGTNIPLTYFKGDDGQKLDAR